MALGKVFEVCWRDIFDAPLVNYAGGDMAGLD
jgi:hypothetical protein